MLNFGKKSFLDYYDYYYLSLFGVHSLKADSNANSKVFECFHWKEKECVECKWVKKSWIYNNKAYFLFTFFSKTNNKKHIKKLVLNNILTQKQPSWDPLPK